MPPPNPQERAYAEALRARVRAAEPLIAERLAQIRGGYAVFALLRATKTFEATRQQDVARARKAAQSPELAQLIKCLKRPGWSSVLTLEKACGRKFGLIDPFYDGPSGVVDLIAEALGVQLDPPPRLDDFTPKGAKR